MAAPLRRAGRLVDAAGRTVTWSVAEGRRGRRWRWSVGDREGGLVVAHTLELDPEGRFARLESVTAVAMLTLHREVDGSIHGNRVRATGIDHLALPAPAPLLALVGGGPVSEAAFAPGLLAAGVPASIELLEVDDELEVRIVAASTGRRGAGTVEIETRRGPRAIRLDERSIPAADGRPSTSWALEGD